MPTDIIDKLHVSSSILLRMGALFVMTSKIEYLTEQLIWALKKENPEGQHPSTDAKPISSLFRMLEEETTKLPQGDLKMLLDCWLTSAKPSFNCRNTIAHGIATYHSNSKHELSFITNTMWAGEKRKRQPKTFIANEHTLDLLVEVYGTLLQGIYWLLDFVEDRISPLQKLTFDTIIRKLKNARSTAVEIDDLPSAVNNEKH